MIRVLSLGFPASRGPGIEMGNAILCRALPGLAQKGLSPLSADALRDANASLLKRSAGGGSSTGAFPESGESRPTRALRKRCFQGIHAGRCRVAPRSRKDSGFPSPARPRSLSGLCFWGILMTTAISSPPKIHRLAGERMLTLAQAARGPRPQRHVGQRLDDLALGHAGR